MRDEEMAIAIVAMVFGFPTLMVIVSQVMKTVVEVVTIWRTTSLKYRLLEAGMSADEIERILDAGLIRGRRKTQAESGESELPPKRGILAKKFAS